MPTTEIVSNHVIGGVIHVSILQDTSQPDPSKAFSAEIHAPGTSRTFAISDGASEDVTLTGVHIGGAASPTIHVEVDDFGLLPAGAAPQQATALHFLLVFKLVEIFRITLGSIPVTARLQH